MLNPNEDTEWNEILRQKGILPPKMVEHEELPPPPDPNSILDKLTSDELDAKFDLLEDGEVDDEEARFLEEYRRKRISLMREEASKSRFGSVREVTKTDWTTEVTDAGDMFVVIHIAEKGLALCSLIDQHFRKLAQKFPKVKFLRGEASLCIQNYPSNNLPSILIYKSGDLKEQLVGPDAVGGDTVTVKQLEWHLAKLGVLESKLTKDPSRRVNIRLAHSNHIKHLTGSELSDNDNNDDDETDDDDAK
ncbi:hypothetical protein MN116_008248 [Schistosoma mekongi]|uniref:Phosducin domain-containing protein n=1 Tax=Schistosoma mekongi TaxID=38744 RepID=A0AAE1Z6M1_SCHME|nr:hypothetical protein MN116_008248 [Schistosoma mekongi]